MDPTLLSVDAQEPSKDGRFRRHEFRRMLGLTRPFRSLLLVGLLSTLIFAALHTMSIGAAFPVLKLLLDDEGLHGWIDRTIAGQRLGVEFTQPTDGRVVSVIKIADGDTQRTALRPGDVLSDPSGGSVSGLLRALAHSEKPLSVVVQRSGETRTMAVTLAPADLKSQMMRRAGTLVQADTLGAQGKLRTLMYVLSVMVLIVLIANVFRVLGEVLIAKAILRSMMRLRAELYERILHLPMSYFASQSTADLVTRFVQDVQEIQRGLITFFGKLLREPLRAVLILGLALALDWRITITMLIVAPLTVGLFWAIGRSVKKANRKLLQSYGAMIDALTSSLHSLRVVKAYTAEDHERDRLGRVDRRVFEQQLKLSKLQAFVTPTIETLAMLAGSVVTVWLASRVLDHQLSIAKFMMLGLTLSILFDPLRKMTDVYVRVQRSTAGAERIFQVIDEPIETDPGETHIDLKPLARAIEYKNVSFTYPGALEPALKNVNMTIHKGETVAIVGPNGSGKTTLMSLLLRFFDPDSGEVCYDGVDIRKVSLKTLRRQIGLVSQEAIIFGGSPTENIAYASSTPDEQQVKDAARRAFAEEFILNIPGGYQATLGERGTTLSGGQRQRLTIARAIFRNAPILIFDEATSQVDSESEQKIQNAVQEFSQERTTLIVAHRLSTIQCANRIVVMDAGSIVDTGTHEELFGRCPLYQTLCNTQLAVHANAVPSRNP